MIRLYFLSLIFFLAGCLETGPGVAELAAQIEELNRVLLDPESTADELERATRALREAVSELRQAVERDARNAIGAGEAVGLSGIVSAIAVALLNARRNQTRRRDLDRIPTAPPRAPPPEA